MSTAAAPVLSRVPRDTKPDPEAVRWGAYALLVLQLAALVFIVFYYRIENEAFARLFALSGAGFAVL